MSRDLSERQALIALNMTQGMGAITAKNLIEFFGSASEIFKAPPEDLARVRGIGKTSAAAFADAFSRVDPVAEEERASRCAAAIITWDDPDYPARLKDIYDPPLVLYICGDRKVFSRTGVAIVGTRNATRYGCETAFRFGYQLASAGYAIVSGMARGIDTEGHRGAVEAHGVTIGVLGGALDKFYPAENRKLAHRVIDEGGAIISEYPFGREPDRQTFPMRNRIVSGLSAGVLVVEAATASGTMITVDQALEQGRAVMAVPGRVDSPTSQGCHKLIRNGARLVTCADDVIDELGTFLPSARPADGKLHLETEAPLQRPANAPSLSEEEQRIIDAIGGAERFVDDLVAATGIEAGRLNGLLVALQIKRFVKLLPGGVVIAGKRE